jgi:hypothetical protein
MSFTIDSNRSMFEHRQTHLRAKLIILGNRFYMSLPFDTKLRARSVRELAIVVFATMLLPDVGEHAQYEPVLKRDFHPYGLHREDSPLQPVT